MLKDGTAIRILTPNEHVKYLGKQLNLINHTDKDIEERIRKGWVKFSEFKSQLCAKGVTKKQKWLLFESVITSTVLYGSCSWTMNNYRRAKLLSAQTKMVRQMMGLQWWKSTAKWEAEQEMDDRNDTEGVSHQTTLHNGSADALAHKGSQRRQEQIHCHRQSHGKYHSTTRSRTKNRRHQATQQIPQRRARSSSTSSSSSSSSSSQSETSSTREGQARIKKMKKFSATYANWIQ